LEDYTIKVSPEMVELREVTKKIMSAILMLEHIPKWLKDSQQEVIDKLFVKQAEIKKRIAKGNSAND